jgi:hypothetical protein
MPHLHWTLHLSRHALTGSTAFPHTPHSQPWGLPEALLAAILLLLSATVAPPSPRSRRRTITSPNPRRLWRCLLPMRSIRSSPPRPRMDQTVLVTARLSGSRSPCLWTSSSRPILSVAIKTPRSRFIPRKQARSPRLPATMTSMASNQRCSSRPLLGRPTSSWLGAAVITRVAACSSVSMSPRGRSSSTPPSAARAQSPPKPGQPSSAVWSCAVCQEWRTGSSVPFDGLSLGETPSSIPVSTRSMHIFQGDGT